mgnify:CR=1 FL=1
MWFEYSYAPPLPRGKGFEFVNKVVGVRGVYETPEIEGMLRGIIISKMTDLLGEIKIPFLDMPAKYDEIGAGTKAQLTDDFARIGLVLKALYVNAITPTEETTKAIDERAAMGAIGDMDKYLKFKAARAMGDPQFEQTELLLGFSVPQFLHATVFG